MIGQPYKPLALLAPSEKAPICCVTRGTNSSTRINLVAHLRSRRWHIWGKSSSSGLRPLDSVGRDAPRFFPTFHPCLPHWRHVEAWSRRLEMAENFRWWLGRPAQSGSLYGKFSSLLKPEIEEMILGQKCQDC